MSNTPHWNLLPHDPVGFFELAEGYDQKALKRSYGKLIRQYKPETHPQEFQRIREAYENLENLLRYGLAQSAQLDRNQAWDDMLATIHQSIQTEFAAGEAIRVPPGSASRPASRIHEQVVNDPHGVYHRLKNQTQRGPQDYWLLAILSDLVDNSDPLMFLKWLLTGLQQFPEDTGLQQLCLHYLQQDLPTDAAAKVLPAMAKALPEHTFFRISEKYWMRVLRETPFEQTRKLFAQCDKLLQHGKLEPRLAFLIRFVQAALWQADDSWTAEQLQFLNQHATELSPILHRELDFLMLVHQYRRQLPSGLHAAETRVVNMIRDYCTLGWREAMASVSRCFDELARDVQGLMEAFPAEPQSRFHLMLEICQTIVNDFLDQMGQPSFTSSEKAVSRLAEATVIDLSESATTVFNNLQWKRWRLLTIPFVVLLLFGYVVAQFFASYKHYGWILVGSLLTINVLYFAWLKPFVLNKRWEKKFFKLLTVEYTKSWRQRLLRYVQSCHAPASVIVQQLGLAGRNLNSNTVVAIINDLAQRDAAIFLLTFAQNLVR